MYSLFSLLVGSVLIGLGTNWKVGLGVALIGFGHHVYLTRSLTNMYLALWKNQSDIFNKIK